MFSILLVNYCCCWYHSVEQNVSQKRAIRQLSERKKVLASPCLPCSPTLKGFICQFSVSSLLFVGKSAKKKNGCGIWSFSIWKSHKYRANLFELFSSFTPSPFTFLSLISSRGQAQSISYFNFFSGPSAQIPSTCYLTSVCCGFRNVQV